MKLMLAVFFAMMVFIARSGQSEDNSKKLVGLLSARLQMLSSLRYDFDYAFFVGKAVDFTVYSYSDDPFAGAHRDGTSDYIEQRKKHAFGSMAHDTKGGRLLVNFTLDGRSYQVFADEHRYAITTPTSLDNAAGPQFVEIQQTVQSGSVYDLGLGVSGFSYTPTCIPQLAKCFGSEHRSITIIDFIQLLQDTRVKKARCRRSRRQHSCIA